MELGARNTMREGGEAEGRPAQAQSSAAWAAQEKDFTGEISSCGTFVSMCVPVGP